ncbi:hypothetical protein ACIBBB_22815 [Streptomyces sp. NPDC051217]|uniref:hypothetical protein n=1 Tax=Streptomyces sp. NPDC051217 TaxID=3365644 RepID=UPI0037B5004A
MFMKKRLAGICLLSAAAVAVLSVPASAAPSTPAHHVSVKSAAAACQDELNKYLQFERDQGFVNKWTGSPSDSEGIVRHITQLASISTGTLQQALLNAREAIIRACG